eukprot:jgi/Chlat1/4218/Chrsp27S04304
MLCARGGAVVGCVLLFSDRSLRDTKANPARVRLVVRQSATQTAGGSASTLRIVTPNQKLEREHSSDGDSDGQACSTTSFRIEPRVDRTAGGLATVTLRVAAPNQKSTVVGDGQACSTTSFRIEPRLDRSSERFTVASTVVEKEANNHTQTHKSTSQHAKRSGRKPSNFGSSSFDPDPCPPELLRMLHVKSTLAARDKLRESLPAAEAEEQEKDVLFGLKRLSTDRAVANFEWLERNGYSPNTHHCTVMFRVYSKYQQVDKAQQLCDRFIQAHADEEAAVRNVHFWTALISSLGDAGRIDEAATTFQRMKLLGAKPNAFTYSAILTACCKAEKWEDTVEYFSEMQSSGIVPDVYIFSTAIKASAGMGNWQRALDIYSLRKRYGVECNAHIYVSLLAALGTAGKWQEALQLFYSMECTPNEYTYAAIIKAVAESWQCERAEHLLREMQHAGSTPNVVVLGSMVHAYEKVQNWQGALSMLQLATDLGIERSNYLWTTAMSACGKSGQLQHVERLFKEMPTPDIVAWETLVAAYGKAGQHVKAQAAFDNMLAAGYKPRDYAIVGLVEAYSNSGHWRQALAQRQVMEELGCKLTVHVFNALIQACERAEQWTTALALYAEMKRLDIQPNAATKDHILAIGKRGVKTVQDQQTAVAIASAAIAAAGSAVISTGLW